MGDFPDRLITRIREESKLEHLMILNHFIALLPNTPPQDDHILEYHDRIREYYWCQRVKGGSCRCERKGHYMGLSSALPLDSMRIHNFVCTKIEERNPFAERPPPICAGWSRGLNFRDEVEAFDSIEK